MNIKWKYFTIKRARGLNVIVAQYFQQ